MAGPASTFRSFVGIARELGRSTAVTAIGAAGATTITLDDATGFTNTSKVTIYDGPLTEVVTASAVAGNVLTVSATANAHLTPGVLVTTVGTASAGPTDYIKVTKFDPADDQNFAEDRGWQGSPADLFDLIATNRSSTLDFSGDLFCDTFGYMLSGVFGDVVFTGGTPNQHAFALLTTGTGQPATFQITDFTGATARQYGGVRFDELTVKASGESLVTWDCKGKAYASGAVSTPTPNLSLIRATPGYAGSVTLAGAATAKLLTFETTFKRQVDPIINIDGGPDPYAFWAGDLAAEGKVSYIYPVGDETFLNYYLQNTQPSLVLAWNIGTGASQVGMTIQMTQAAHTSGKPVRGKSYLQLDADLKGVANTTDAGASGGKSPAKVILRNARPTGTFG